MTTLPVTAGGIMPTPVIFESGQFGEQAWDVFSRLAKERILWLGCEVNETSAGIICSMLTFLDSQGSKDPIQIYINSPGGLISSLLAIYDTMQFVKAPIHTLCLGEACSAAAVILLAGEKGHRRILPNAEVMIHQPSGGYIGKSTDMEINTKRVIRLREKLDKIVSKHTGQKIADVKEAMIADRWFTATQAVEWGIVDSIVHKSKVEAI